MARKVFISSDMSVDKRLGVIAETDPISALLWPWLLTVFDDWGRAEVDARKLKANVFPNNKMVTVRAIKRALEQYRSKELLLVYTVEGKTYMVNLDHFDLFHRYARPSRYPDPPATNKKIRQYIQKCKAWKQYGETPWLKYRRLVFQRDSYTCVYCGAQNRLSVDHIMPRSKGGADTPDNLVTACLSCNIRKSDRTPEEAGMVFTLRRVLDGS
jgi:5-methylcytosine-specific restriction endonuclease McrA